MRTHKVLLMTAALTLGTSLLWADGGDGFEAKVVDARYTRGSLSMDKSARVWKKATPLEVSLHRQKTVPLLDRDYNALLKSGELGPRSGWMKAVYNKSELGLMLSWPDETMDQLVLDESNVFGDTAAIMFPQEYGGDHALPYIGMGDESHSVIVTLKRAHWENNYDRQFVAAGFGSLNPIDVNTQMSLDYDEEAKQWTAIFIRPIQDDYLDLSQGLVPIGAALWDGSTGERGGMKSVMGWHFIRFERNPADLDYEEYVSWGETGLPVGNAENGGKLASSLCIGCHQFDTWTLAAPGMAPDLNAIGSYSSPQYLKESIADPSAIVLRHLNINRHQNRAGEKDKNGAYPNNDFYTWFVEGADGAKISKMPAFTQLSESDVNDIVSYLIQVAQDEAESIEKGESK